MPRTKRSRVFNYMMMLALMLPIIAACGGGGTSSPTAGTGATATSANTTANRTATPAGATPGTQATAAATATKGTDTNPGGNADAIIIGLAQEPDTMYSVITSMAVQRVVDRAINEPWVTTLDYTFKANPRYLDGDLPTLENKGAVMNNVQAYVDATGAVTTTQTGTPTTTKQLVVTFKMKPGLKWSDGQPLTSRDVVFGHKVACDPNSGTTSFAVCDKVEKVEAVNDTTWRVVYKPGQTYALYFQYYAETVLPEHQLKNVKPEDIQKDPRVTEYPLSVGPYKLEQGGWKKGQSITLTKNEHYVDAAKGLPKVPKVVFQIIPDTNQLWASVYAGEVDVAESSGLQADLAQTIENAEKAGKVRAYFLSSATWEHFDFNFNDPKDLKKPSLLADPAVRHAIAYGSNRKGYVNAVYSGKSDVMNSWIPKTHWAYAGDDNLTLYTYDVTRANQLLDQAGYTAGADGIRAKNGQRLSFNVRTTVGNKMRERLTQLFQADMKKIGVEIKIDLLPASVWFGDESGLARRDFDIGEFAWVGQADPTGETLYACDQIPGPENNWNGQNSMGWCNETANNAIKKANSELIQSERKKWYVIHQQEFTKDLPSLPLFNRLEIFASAPDLQNFNPNPTEYFTWNIGDWSAPPRNK